jgi:hypothetical protein
VNTFLKSERGLRLMKTNIVIEIENCSQCPYVKRYCAKYGSDIYCRKAQRTVAEMVEYVSELNDKTPPVWCPCRLEENNRETVD